MTRCLLLMLLTFVFVGCDLSNSKTPPVSGSAAATLTYQPPYAPISLSINTLGEVSVQGESTVNTFIGRFSLGAGYTLNPDPGYTHVIIRDRRRGASDQEAVYRVYTGGRELSFVSLARTVGEETRINIQDRRIVVDVSDGLERTVSIRSTEAIPLAQQVSLPTSQPARPDKDAICTTTFVVPRFSLQNVSEDRKVAFCQSLFVQPMTEFCERLAAVLETSNCLRRERTQGLSIALNRLRDDIYRVLELRISKTLGQTSSRDPNWEYRSRVFKEAHKVDDAIQREKRDFSQDPDIEAQRLVDLIRSIQNTVNNW